MKTYIIQVDLTISGEEKAFKPYLYEFADDCILNLQDPIFDVIDYVQNLWSELLAEQIIFVDSIPLYADDVYSFIIYEIDNLNITSKVYIQKRGYLLFDNFNGFFVEHLKRTFLTSSSL